MVLTSPAMDFKPFKVPATMYCWRLNTGSVLFHKTVFESTGGGVGVKRERERQKEREKQRERERDRNREGEKQREKE